MKHEKCGGNRGRWDVSAEKSLTRYSQVGCLDRFLKVEVGGTGAPGYSHDRTAFTWAPGDKSFGRGEFGNIV